ncbi:MAG: hypothetical protein M1401_02960 [Chloroflexi bacterium]|nr:hypothetical protein [Chloroflexota bacterium]MCL5107835.1 hypothetical protein [Chloroflexota bacterium]
MNRRTSEAYDGDWADVFCSVCHQPIGVGEWHGEEENDTICLACHSRLSLMEESPQTSGSRRRPARQTPSVKARRWYED